MTSTTSVALAASLLAPRFGERPQDALCLGLLAQVGVALLHHNDPEGYRELLAEEATFPGRRAAEVRRYGISGMRLTSVALEQWGFPHSMVGPLSAVDDRSSTDGALLRCAFELAARLTQAGYQPVDVAGLSDGQLREDAVGPVLDQVAQDADELRRAMLDN